MLWANEAKGIFKSPKIEYCVILTKSYMTVVD